MDREADNFALFDAHRQHGRVDMLVRARHNRLLAKGRKLYATLRGGPAAAKVQIEIKRVTARAKSSRKKARRGRRHRIAQAEVRYHCVQLPDTRKEVDPVTMYGVHVRETAPPTGEQAVEWFLLTTMAVHSAEEAVRILKYYTRRWRIEDFFRVLKSGCKVERMALRTAQRLERGDCDLLCDRLLCHDPHVIGACRARIGRRRAFLRDGVAFSLQVCSQGEAACAPHSASGDSAASRIGRLPESQP